MLSENTEELGIIRKKRKACLAFLLSLILPGFGQIYNTQLTKGIIFYILIEAVSLVVGIKYFSSFSGLVLFLTIILSMTLFCAIEAFVTARRKRLAELRPYNKWYFYVLIIVMGILLSEGLGMAVKPVFNYKNYRYPSGSMLPTMMPGDMIMVDLNAYDQKAPARGDVIIFKYPQNPKRSFLKRVVAIGGDIVEMKDKLLYLNGKLLDEPYVQHLDPEIKKFSIDPRDNFGPITVPGDKMFVLGDNRDYSHDSRYWGFVDNNAVIGKALYVYLSLDKGWHLRSERLGQRLD